MQLKLPVSYGILEKAYVKVFKFAGMISKLK